MSIKSPQCSTCLNGAPYAACPGLKTCTLIARMERDRDELLAALNTLVLGCNSAGYSTGITWALEQATAIIAKHTPKAPA